ncbi:MAG: hypothetical protein CML06_08705 [Pseudomonadales bacterium]|nr:hypothetical protein [Pseudomonadales bacterium]
METLLGYHLDAKDDRLGRCKDFLFDDRDWVVRYMVADTHRWLPGGRNVLISPISLGIPHEEEKAIPVKLNVDQIKDSPPLEENRPISREYELRLFQYYGYGFYWMGNGLWGTHPHPGPLVDTQALDEQEGRTEEREYHLRSASEIDGYSIRALDDNLGHVDDILVDDVSWQIQYLVINTRNWLPGGKRIVVPRQAVAELSWPQQLVKIDRTEDQIKAGIEYEPDRLADPNYEARLEQASRKAA